MKTQGRSSQENIDRLLQYGFHIDDVTAALQHYGNDINSAYNYLLESQKEYI